PCVSFAAEPNCHHTPSAMRAGTANPAYASFTAQRLGRPRAIASATASGAATEIRRGSKAGALMSGSEDAGGEGPQHGHAAQEPVDVVVEPARVERAGPEADEFGRAGEPPDDDTGQAHDIDEVEDHGRALLDLGRLIVVRGVKRRPERDKESEDGPGLPLERVPSVRRIECERRPRADDQHDDAGGEDDRMGRALRLRDLREHALEGPRVGAPVPEGLRG